MFCFFQELFDDYAWGDFFEVKGEFWLSDEEAFSNVKEEAEFFFPGNCAGEFFQGDFDWLVDDRYCEVVIAGEPDSCLHFTARRHSCKFAELLFEIMTQQIEEESFDAEVLYIPDMGFVPVEECFYSGFVQL